MLQKIRNISGLLLKRRISHTKIGEEQVQILLDSLAELCESRDDIRSEASEYAELTVMVDEMWHYRDVHALSAEEAFLYGGIWGAARLEHLMHKKDAEKASMAQLVHDFQDKKKEESSFRLLELIDQNPGIKHKDLAEQLGISPSMLSQIAAKLEPERLFMAQRSGREKYYFLQTRGKELIRRLRPVEDEMELLGGGIVINASNDDHSSVKIASMSVDGLSVKENKMYGFPHMELRGAFCAIEENNETDFEGITNDRQEDMRHALG